MGLIDRLVKLGYKLDTAIDIFYKHLSVGCIKELQEEIERREREDGVSAV